MSILHGWLLFLALLWFWGYYQTASSDASLPSSLQEDRFVKVPLAIAIMCAAAKAKNAPARVMSAQGLQLQLSSLAQLIVIVVSENLHFDNTLIVLAASLVVGLAMAWAVVLLRKHIEYRI